jgi:hypothetical protein
MKRTCLPVLLLFLAATFGCTGSRPARVVVVFVDVSASAKDFAVYKRCLDQNCRRSPARRPFDPCTNLRPDLYGLPPHARLRDSPLQPLA